MLVLSRKIGEKILVPDCDVEITVVAVVGNRVRIGVSAPDDVEVHREEIWRAIRSASEVGVPPKG